MLYADSNTPDDMLYTMKNWKGASFHSQLKNKWQMTSPPPWVYVLEG